MEIVIFARFHAREGQEAIVAAAIGDIVPASRAEPGCRAITAYVSVRDHRLFWIRSRWVNEAAFARWSKPRFQKSHSKQRYGSIGRDRFLTSGGGTLMSRHFSKNDPRTGA